MKTNSPRHRIYGTIAYSGLLVSAVIGALASCEGATDLDIQELRLADGGVGHPAADGGVGYPPDAQTDGGRPPQPPLGDLRAACEAATTNLSKHCDEAMRCGGIGPRPPIFLSCGAGVQRLCKELSDFRLEFCAKLPSENPELSCDDQQRWLYLDCIYHGRDDQQCSNARNACSRSADPKLACDVKRQICGRDLVIPCEQRYSQISGPDAGGNAYECGRLWNDVCIRDWSACHAAVGGIR